MIEAILLDVDGTLTNGKKEITPKTVAALEAAEEAGIRLVLASGRTANGLARFGRALDMQDHGGIFVCYNGAKAVNCETGDVLFNSAMSVDAARRVLEHMKKFDVWPVLDKGEYMYVNDVFAGMVTNPDGTRTNIIQYESRSNSYLLCEKRDLAAFVDWEPNKILVAGEPAYLEKHWQEMAAPFEGELSSMFTAPYYYEYTAKGVDKSKALSECFADLGIAPEHVIAFGDAQNDITMLRWAGIGVAMGNAVDETKAAADEVTLSNEEDGIAASLANHLPDICG
ncbi:MAG: Cof-type HAD-IIB family hydrolase [Atopobiaceae bacterium]